ncbi:hypothetical protein [uncultured Friedmanniella sp.]|uniref:hypothetical protein n=1 Tax=uncultured Friedmanniella sp. TaxID=335381 RepID=UPI0035C9E1BD
MRRTAQPPPDLVLLARRQQRVATRAQLRSLGLTQVEIRAQIAARRWTGWGSHVVLLHNADPSRRQLMWASTLDAGPPAALVGHTALELVGFRDFARAAVGIHLRVPRGAKVVHHPSVVVHESRRVQPERQVTRHGLPCTDAAPSVLDAAAWQPWPRFACALVAAVVQQRLCTTPELDAALTLAGRIRHKAYLREAVRDIAGGSEALSELDLVAVCRRFGLAPPDRQVRRTDAHGRLRYLDAEWVLSSGERVLLEVDGAHHLEVEHWQADMRRERGLVLAGSRVLRATSLELRLEPATVVQDLLSIGVSRVVRTQVSPRATQF